MVDFEIHPGGKLTGELTFPGDKSISHRASLLAAIATGESEIINFLPGDDNLHTLTALEAMGVVITKLSPTHLRIQGRGKKGLKPPATPLYLGNSGTGARLLTGLIAGQNLDSMITGDDSLQSRPMSRIIEPLKLMGARLEASDNRLPLRIYAQPQLLTAIHYQIPIASAQVKSCLLLAGLNAEGTQTLHETTPTRDHTERLLRYFGYPCLSSGNTIILNNASHLTANEIEIPGDFSSAAFFIVGACIAPGSELIIKNIGLNPHRTGLLSLLKMMGADIEILEHGELGNEPMGTLRIRASALQGITIPKEYIAATIDEFPALFIACAVADGETVLTNASELKYKESNRLAAMALGLKKLGIQIELLEDGIRIQGGEIKGGIVDSQADHRIAMAFAMAALVASQKIFIKNCNNVTTSFPNFIPIAQQAGVRI